jgi:riboflavin transporter FmnP
MRGPEWLRDLPRPAAWALVGLGSAGLIGAIAGLIVGLMVYAPTAWFAAVELGLPAAVVGAVLGTLAGTIATLTGCPRKRPRGASVSGT